MSNLPAIKLPAAIRKIGGTKFGMMMRRNWPTIATGVGCTSVIAGTIAACYATTKLPDILEEHEYNMHEIHRVEESEAIKTDPADIRKEKAKVFAKTALKVGKLYAPAAAIEGVGIVLIAKSHSEMGHRQAALSAAYSTFATSFEAYRDRVAKELGEDKEKKLYLGMTDIEAEEEEVNPETGRKKKVKTTKTVINVDPTDFSRYARCFCKYQQTPDGQDDIGSREFRDYDSSGNLFFLKSQQNYANDLLHINGWVSLNEVYELLGFPKTLDGQVVGWVDTPEKDKVIDFGIYDVNIRTNQIAINQPAGFAPAIMLDFNIDPKTFYDTDPSFFRN